MRYHYSRLRYPLLVAALGALASSLPGPGFANERPADGAAPAPFTDSPQATNSKRPDDLSPVHFEQQPNYLVPVVDILGFEFLLNRFDYYVISKKTYGTTAASVRRNLRGKWVVDNDPFDINQFLHPYQGATYFGLARSAGVDYWHSLGYTVGGSLLWEIAGETTAPSINDLIATGIGGTFLGEPLFRMASLLLEKGGDIPSFWREIGAAVISPPLGFNRLVFGKRFAPVFASHDPAYEVRVSVGASYIDHAVGEDASVLGHKEALADFHIAYGLPGKAGYSYTRPFDYFDFRFTTANRNAFENILSRGLLVGKDYHSATTQGVWGIYGSYDYITPRPFRVSSTALSIGTTREDRPSPGLAIQTTALAGLGYGAAGTIPGSGERRNYHYGVTPQALLSTRFLFGDRADLELNARAYYVSKVGSTEYRGSDTIFRGDASFTMRIHGPHGLTVRYVASHRDARYPDLQAQHQTVGTVSLLYTYLGDAHAGGGFARQTASGPVDAR